MMMLRSLATALVLLSAIPLAAEDSAPLERIMYNNPGPVVDLGVGLWAWPLPMDFDGDGDLDLVVVCPDKPYNGTWFFENPSSNEKLPVFKPARRISGGLQNVQISYVNGEPRVLSPGQAYPEFLHNGLAKPVKLPLPANIHPNRVRANQWKYADYDGDEVLDLIVGVGDWTDYGWDDAFEADGKPVDVFGMPSPNFADFDGDGDLDLLCGEFLDGFTYFENTGTRTKPRYAAGRRLIHEGRPLTMDLQMIVPVAIDWDRDGDFDLVVGDEDGRVALVENTGELLDGLPQFLSPRYFQQQAHAVKFGALATPVGFDWDGDGDEDILCGNTAGYIGFFENLSGPGIEQPRWAAPRRLEADGEVIRIQAGPNGSIQGPCEAKWGYTTLTVADWDHDQRPDLVVNSIWGKVQWYRNIGTRSQPKLAAAQQIEVEWDGPAPKPAWNWWGPQENELVTQWRTTPVAIDFNADGLCDLVMLDHEGYLAFFERRQESDGLKLLPGRRIFVDEQLQPLQLNPGRAGKSGRRKLCITDWDGDGRLDVLANSENANWLRQVDARDGLIVFRDEGRLDERKVSGHTTSPTVVDWNGDRVPDLLVGAEDGYLYYKRNPRSNSR